MRRSSSSNKIKNDEVKNIMNLLDEIERNIQNSTYSYDEYTSLRLRFIEISGIIHDKEMDFSDYWDNA